MAFRQMARESEVFEVEWPEPFAVRSWADADTEEIAEFLLGTGSKAFADLWECADGSSASARNYVTRTRDYMRARPDAALGDAVSSLVSDNSTGRLVGLCLCCGPSVYHTEVHPDYQRRGIATCMLKRALTVCAERGVPRLDLWRNDDSMGRPVYERLGFALTGAVEGEDEETD